MEKGFESYLRFLKGNQSEMKSIVESYWDGMLLFTNNYVHNLSDAEDIAQEALIRLSIRRPHLKEEHQLKTWLLKTCRNLALNHLKKQKKFLAISPEDAECIEDETAEVEKRMELADSVRLLHHAMRQLKQEYREVLFLRYFENLSTKETADILKCTEKQAASLAFQARQKLRTILEKEGYSGENL